MTWVDQLERRARVIHNEIATWRARASALGIDPETACAPFYKKLDEIYADDFPLAKAKDSSDLLLHLEGRAVENTPKLSLVSWLFTNVKGQVRDLAKVISGITPETRVTVRDIDLGLSGLARGSLFVGFSVPIPETRSGQTSMLGSEDPIFKATKDALRIINTVSHAVTVADEQEAAHRLAEDVDDPSVRDAALVAVRRITPSGKSGVSGVGVTSSTDRRVPALLTPQLRYQIGNLLARPVSSTEILELEGIVREIDLDARRFELRGINSQELRNIRCAYGGVSDVLPHQLLDARVRVTGRVDRRPDELPRLMAVENIQVLDLLGDATNGAPLTLL